MTKHSRDMVDIVEAARRSGRHPNTIYAAIRDDRLLGAERRGTKWYVPEDFKIEDHHHKLSPEEREDVRRRARQGESATALAKEKGLSVSYIFALKSGRR